MTASGPNIGLFEAADLPAVRRIWEAASEPVFRSFRGGVGEETAAVASDHADADAERARSPGGICAAASGHHAPVATVGGGVAGSAACTIDAERRTGGIGLNAARPHHAGRGVGTRMRERALARVEAGVALATVGTGADPGHAPARRAYGQAGFGPAPLAVHLGRTAQTWVGAVQRKTRRFAQPGHRGAEKRDPSPPRRIPLNHRRSGGLWCR